MLNDVNYSYCKRFCFDNVYSLLQPEKKAIIFDSRGGLKTFLTRITNSTRKIIPNKQKLHLLYVTLQLNVPRGVIFLIRPTTDAELFLSQYFPLFSPFKSARHQTQPGYQDGTFILFRFCC